MENSIKLLISSLHEHPHYNDFEELVSRSRPRVPKYNFKDDNSEQWKVCSGQQQGFDLFASLLNIKFEE